MLRKNKKAGFTLIELLVVTVIIGILSSLGLPVYESQKDKSIDAWANAIIANVSKIILADEFISPDGVNFADLDSDGTYIGAADPVTRADVSARLLNQGYTLPADNRDLCFLYGYESVAAAHDDMLVVANRTADTGTGAAGFMFAGTDSAKIEAANITAIDCTPGSEGVTGGTWTNYQWLNLVP